MTSTKIADGTIANADIAADAVTSGTIFDGTIVNADIADGTITAAKLSFAAGGGGFTMEDNLGALIGPLAGFGGSNPVLLVTIGGNTFHLTMTFKDNSNDEPSDDYQEIFLSNQFLYYTGANCTGSTYFQPDSFVSPVLFGLYNVAFTAGSSAGDNPVELWVPDTTMGRDAVTVRSRRAGNNFSTCDDGFTDVAVDYWPASQVSSNLKTLWTRPWVLLAN